jgi:hypothetical protein
MPTSDARIAANRLNAQHSTGPKTDEGKERSRANALKHGLTGAGIVLPQTDDAEVKRRSITFASELNAVGDVGQTLARLAALNSVRMERGADQQTASLTEHVRQVAENFVAPEGATEEEADQLCSEAIRIAMFDPSKEAALARRYEATAQRIFLRCIKELRQSQRAAKAEAKAEIKGNATQQFQTMMGSFFQEQKANRQMDAEFDALYAEYDMPKSARPTNSPHSAAMTSKIDLPISAARRR